MISVKLLVVFFVLQSTLQVCAVPSRADSTEVQQGGNLASALAADDTCLGTQDTGSTLGEPACGTELLQTRGLSVHPAREAAPGATISNFNDEVSKPLKKAPYPRTMNKTSQLTSHLLKHGHDAGAMPNGTAMSWPFTSEPTEAPKDTCGKGLSMYTRRHCVIKETICANDCSFAHAELHALCETLEGKTAESGPCGPTYSCPVEVKDVEQLAELIGMSVPSFLSDHLTYLEFEGFKSSYVGCAVENTVGTLGDWLR